MEASAVNRKLLKEVRQERGRGVLIGREERWESQAQEEIFLELDEETAT